VPASSAASSVPLPYSVAAAADPAEAFVAAASSCHMLFFLFFAAKQGFIVDRYLDEAIGSMDRLETY
jgi:organic hydroperoxide reductase OsmC/OhrA